MPFLPAALVVARSACDRSLAVTIATRGQVRSTVYALCSQIWRCLQSTMTVQYCSASPLGQCSTTARRSTRTALALAASTYNRFEALGETCVHSSLCLASGSCWRRNQHQRMQLSLTGSYVKTRDVYLARVEAEHLELELTVRSATSVALRYSASDQELRRARVSRFHFPIQTLHAPKLFGARIRDESRHEHAEKWTALLVTSDGRHEIVTLSQSLLTSHDLGLTVRFHGGGSTAPTSDRRITV